MKRTHGTRVAFRLVKAEDGSAILKTGVQVERLERDENGKITERVPETVIGAPSLTFSADNTVSMNLPSGSLVDVATAAANASRIGNTFAKKAQAIAQIEEQFGEKLNISERDKALLTLGFGGKRFVNRQDL